MTEPYPVTVHVKPDLSSSALVVGWTQDAGRLGTGVVDYLIHKLGAEEFAVIEPVDFFPLGGVLVEGNLAEFPESTFYWCRQPGLVLFKSALPVSDWYRFLDLVLDVAERYGNVREIFTIGGMFSLASHSVPREIFAIPNSPEMRLSLQRHEVPVNMDYETPPGQRPTMNSFLLWVAKRRSIAGAGLWTSVPFYLAGVHDRQACRKAVGLLDERFGWGLDHTDLDRDVGIQNERIAELRSISAEVDDCLRKVETGTSLAEQEIADLAARIEEHLGASDRALG